MPAQEIILLVNDVPDHAASYEHALIRHGFHVRVVRSGKEAIAAARSSTSGYRTCRGGICVGRSGNQGRGIRPESSC
jgi:CheY-like chemotaxis protein